ncbi:hypothetical protein ACHQM5_021958 [Ranunculus cassubicifolius]
MEEDKKKKKNKKKKNKQAAKQQLDESKQESSNNNNNGETTVSSEKNYTSDSLQIVSKDDTNGVENCGRLESDVKQGGDHAYDINGANVDQTEKQIWLQKEATLEDKIKQLETYKGSCVEKEVVLENKISVLRKENNFLLQKEASIDQQLKDLLNEKANWSLKEAALEDKIKQLEKDSESWILKENSSRETIDRLSKEYMEVQAKVKVLEESRDGLLHENQELIERLSFLQSHIEHLEEKRSFSASSTTEVEQMQHPAMEAANSLEEKLITENAKGSELTVQLPEIASFDSNIPEYRSEMLETQEIVEAAPVVVDNVEETRSQGSYEMDEIVQIPLDETEIQEVEVEDAEKEDNDGITLTEAPLTGAPFRFISFVARYVSGADLVNQNISKSGK